MHKMGEAVARVARRVNDTVENERESLDLSGCGLVAFPVGIYKAVRSVAQGIRRVSLAHNELRALAGTFPGAFSQLRGERGGQEGGHGTRSGLGAAPTLPGCPAELRLEGNQLQRLPEEMRALQQLRAINLSRNRFRRFPEPLAALGALESVELQHNEIA
ncbi:LRC20 protein, partial [Eudromia elegans]|nr:LRC20 protein [Eudromia elegans]